MARTQVKRRLNYPPEMVWAALTDPEQMEKWLMPNDFRPEVGRRFQFRTRPAPGFDGVVDCEVREIQANRQLIISWKGGGIDTTVRFELAPAGSGTALTVVQDGFGLKDVFPYFILGQGWKSIVGKKLPAVLATLEARVG